MNAPEARRLGEAIGTALVWLLIVSGVLAWTFGLVVILLWTLGR